MARRFLLVIAALIALAVIAGVVWSAASDRLMRAALVPSQPFAAQRALAPSVYDRADMWLARPGLSDDPSRYRPEGFADPAPQGPAAVFFIHPTSFLDRSAWNASLEDAGAQALAVKFVRGQASALAGAGAVWAPRYRQATFGAFLTTGAARDAALDLAYHDVREAFEAFLAQAGPDRPLILAGHSQGALHLLRLLHERVATDPGLRRRLVAAYAVGWPVSVEHDLPALGLPACAAPATTGCVISWQSFAEPADPKLVVDAFGATTGFDGQPRRESHFLCSNPLTGGVGGAAPAAANRGGLVPNADFSAATLRAGLVPAHCDAGGLLLIGPPPAGIGTYVLPGNNYHVFDYSLFWANVRADAVARTAAWAAGR